MGGGLGRADGDGRSVAWSHARSCRQVDPADGTADVSILKALKPQLFFWTFNTAQGPFANEKAARAANNGALPPDLSVITKAREGGADYIHALLMGYEDPPAGMRVADGMHYNKYFAGHQIAMPPPITSEGQVEYHDGTKATVDQMVSDVSQFLTWAAEPELEERKSMGVKMILFLTILGGLAYAVKRKVWADVH